jgi:hypothetical protein
MVSIISGYNEQLCSDKDGLANWVGGALLKTGLAGLVMAIGVTILPQYLMALVALFALAIVGGTLTTAIGANKYKGKN